MLLGPDLAFHYIRCFEIVQRVVMWVLVDSDSLLACKVILLDTWAQINSEGD